MKHTALSGGLFVTTLVATFVVGAPRPVHAQDAALAKKGEAVYAAQKCMTCHSVAGKGSKVSPLDGVGAKLSAEQIREWIVDPVAMANAARVRPDLRYAESVHDAAQGVDLVLHLTEWADYRAIEPEALRSIVANPVLIDGRCTLDAAVWRAAGWTVLIPGRPQG